MNMFSPLNWKEISLLTDAFRSKMEGAFLDQLIIPKRACFPSGYIKGEWALRFSSKAKSCCFIFSVRTRHPYIALDPSKTIPSAENATHSPFDLALSRHLRGARLMRLEALSQERVMALWFSHPSYSSQAHSGQASHLLGLVLVLIPSAPEALLVDRPPVGNTWSVIVRSRSSENRIFTPPDGSRAPHHLLAREVVERNPIEFYKFIDQDLETEAFELRIQKAKKALRENIKQTQDRIRQSEVKLKEAQSEPDWQYFGDLLKGSLFAPPPLSVDHIRRVTDLQSQQIIDVPCDPQLSPSEQVQKFYRLHHRKSRRLQEAKERIQSLAETQDQLRKLESELPGEESGAPTWQKLENIEKSLGISPGLPAIQPKKAEPASTSGKTFFSKEGLRIFVGRNQTENLDLTFKQARGNDLWMHVRGRSGAHIVISMPSDKSASLETLLDAACIVIYYSGGEHWGTTEVDYTLKKHVKRIKDSNEVSYTHNKTLLVQFDSERMRRLLEQ